MQKASPCRVEDDPPGSADWNRCNTRPVFPRLVVVPRDEMTSARSPSGRGTTHHAEARSAGMSTIHSARMNCSSPNREPRPPPPPTTRRDPPWDHLPGAELDRRWVGRVEDSAGRPRSVASSSMFSSPSSMSTSTVVVVASSPSSATAGSSCRVARGVGPDEERLSASSEKASVATGMGAAESTVPSASERAWLVRSRRASIWRALAASLRAGKNRRGEGKPSRARASGGFRRVATPQTRCGPPRDRDSRRTFDSAAGMTLGSSPSSDAADDRS